MCRVQNEDHSPAVIHKLKHVVLVYTPDTQEIGSARIEGFHLYPDGSQSKGEAHTYYAKPTIGHRCLDDVRQLSSSAPHKRPLLPSALRRIFNPQSSSFNQALFEKLRRAWELTDTEQDNCKPAGR